MGVTDNKTVSGGLSLKQILTVVVIFALCAVAIYTNSLVIGYVVATLALCVFFLMVAFDFGVKPGAIGSVQKTAESPRDSMRRPVRGRTAREL